MYCRFIILFFWMATNLFQTNAQVLALNTANTSLSIDVAAGARIVSLQLDGKEILGSSHIHPHFYGSSLWLSPEGKWKGMGALDTALYTIQQSGPEKITLKSKDDSIRGFSFTKEFRVNDTDTSFTLRYTITNISGYPQDVAPWEVTRVPTGGLALFPGGDQPALAKSDLPVRDSLGIVWYPYDSLSRNHQKLFRHGAEGWTTYVKNGVVFIKSYPVIAPGSAAPGEENVEVYANPEKTYIELENQGAYQHLAPQASLQVEVKWLARRLPHDCRETIGDKALLSFIRSTILK